MECSPKSKSDSWVQGSLPATSDMGYQKLFSIEKISNIYNRFWGSSIKQFLYLDCLKPSVTYIWLLNFVVKLKLELNFLWLVAVGKSNHTLTKKLQSMSFRLGQFLTEKTSVPNCVKSNSKEIRYLKKCVWVVIWTLDGQRITSFNHNWHIQIKSRLLLHFNQI